MKKICFMITAFMICLIMSNTNVYATEATDPGVTGNATVKINNNSSKYSNGVFYGGRNLSNPQPTQPPTGTNEGSAQAEWWENCIYDLKIRGDSSDLWERLPVGVIDVTGDPDHDKASWSVPTILSQTATNARWHDPNGWCNWYVDWEDRYNELPRMSNTNRRLADYDGHWEYKNKPWRMRFACYMPGKFNARQTALGYWYWVVKEEQQLDVTYARTVIAKFTDGHEEAVEASITYPATRTVYQKYAEEKWRVYSGDDYEEDPDNYEDYEWFLPACTGCDLQLDNDLEISCDCYKVNGEDPYIDEYPDIYPHYDDDEVEYWLEGVY